MRLLRWMRKQHFSVLVQDRGLPHGSLLKTVEHIVVENHRFLYQDFMRQPWSAPVAYRWMRYENPDPVSQLEEATSSLERLWKGALVSQPQFASGILKVAARHEDEHLEEIAPLVRRLGLRRF